MRIIKIRKEGDNFLIFTKEGMLVSVSESELEDFINNSAKVYEQGLMNHCSEKPIYPAPVLAHLAITNKCDMTCKYCSVRKSHCMLGNEISTEKWKGIIRELAEWGVFQIGFTGGEPTLRKDLVELAKCVYDNGCVFNLTTNGWALDKDLVGKLVEAGMKQCQISMDSHIPAVHDRLRGKGSFERVLRSIKILKEKGVSVGVDCVVSKNNLFSIQKFISWMRKNEIPYLTLIKLKKGDLSEEEYFKLAPGYFEYANLIKTVCEREMNESPNITLDCGSVSNLQAIAPKENFKDIPVSGCPIGHHLICVNPNGDVYSCAALLDKKFCLGNVLRDDIKKIWVENEFLKKARLIKKKILGECSSCERLDFCRGGCRGIVYSLQKNFEESDSTCKFQEVQNGNKSR